MTWSPGLFAPAWPEIPGAGDRPPRTPWFRVWRTVGGVKVFVCLFKFHCKTRRGACVPLLRFTRAQDLCRAHVVQCDNLTFPCFLALRTPLKMFTEGQNAPRAVMDAPGVSWDVPLRRHHQPAPAWAPRPVGRARNPDLRLTLAPGAPVALSARRAPITDAAPLAEQRDCRLRRRRGPTRSIPVGTTPMTPCAASRRAA